MDTKWITDKQRGNGIRHERRIGMIDSYSLSITTSEKKLKISRRRRRMCHRDERKLPDTLMS